MADVAGARRYMSKSQRACDFCRLRKSACRITDSPPCRLCSLNGRACTFDHGTARRSRAPRSVPKEAPPEVQPQLQADGLHVPLESIVTPLPDLSNLITVASESIVPEHWPVGGPGEVTSDYQLDIAGGTQDQRLFGGLTSVLQNQPFTLDDDLLRYVLGPTGEQDPNLLQRYRFNEHGEFWFKKLATRTTFPGPNPVLWMLSVPEQHPGDNLDSPASSHIITDKEMLESLVPPYIGERIIKLFFKFICPQFPLLSQDTTTSASETPIHLLAAIYLIASPFFNYDEYLAIEVVYNPPSPQALFDIAWRSFKDNLHSSSVSMVQTALIFLLTTPKDPFDLDVTFKWSLLGLTVSLAQTIGLHLQPTTWQIPQAQIRLRKRLSWLVYGLDTWLALYLGRSPHISHENWMIIELDEEAIDSSDVEQGSCRLAVPFSGLTSILNSVLQKLFTLRATEILTINFRQTLETARPLLLELSSWQKENPSSFEADNSLPLKISFFAVQFAVFRALLRTFDNKIESSFHLSETEQAEFEEARQHCRDAARICIETSLEFISSLDSKYFSQFWPPWTSTCFTHTPAMCMLLVCSSRDVKEATELKLLLTKIRGVLRTQSRAYDAMRLAVLRTDAHFWLGIDNVLEMNPRLGCTFKDLNEEPD